VNIQKFIVLFTISFVTILLYSEGELDYTKSGVLLYKIKDGITYFLVGYNQMAHAMSDLGSQYDSTKDCDIFSTAARGFNEKTMFKFSAGGISTFDITQLYAKPYLAMHYHQAIKSILQRPSTLQLQVKDQGKIEYTIFIVPMTEMPAQPIETTHKFNEMDKIRPIPVLQELKDLSIALTRSMPELKLEIPDFAWLRKENLYEALTETEPGDVVIVDAPIQHNLKRTLTLFIPFANVLINGTDKKGRVGLQAILP